VRVDHLTGRSDTVGRKLVGSPETNEGGEEESIKGRASW